jgi:glycogen(starch) synthase
VSKQSGVAEVFNNCLKVDYWDEHEMANKIVSVLRNPALADELRRNSWTEFQSLNWDSAAGKIMDRYNYFKNKVPA